MLAPRASSAFVCLRCELTLARRRLPALPRRTPHASFSASSRIRRDAFDEEFEKSKPNPQLSERPLARDALDEAVDTTTQKPQLSERPLRQDVPDGEFDPARRRPRLSARPLRHDAPDGEPDTVQGRPQLSGRPLVGLARVRKRKGGGAIRETTARLEGTKTLGEDAAILVLEELEAEKKEAEAEPEVPDDDESHPPLKLADAIAGEKPATPEEIVEQLDTVRRKIKTTHGEAGLDEGLFVSQSVFVKLSKYLLRAFTGPQLSLYYSVRKGVDKDRVAREVIAGVKQLQSKARRPAERSEWTPGTTDLNRRLPGLDVHRTNKRKAVRKHLLVDQILRDVWQLVMLEELEAAGELELALKDWQLALLTSGAPETPVDRIQKARIAKLQLNTSDKVLRITADKHTAEYAANDVEELLQASESYIFHLKPWIPYLDIPAGTEPSIKQVFPSEVIQTVATMTGAYIQLSTKNVIIRALDKDAVAEAERCLIKLMPLKDRYVHTVDSTGRNVFGSSDHFLPVTFEKEAVSYNLRNAKLGRWSSPVGRNDTPLPVSESIAERVNATQEQVAKMAITPQSQNERSTSPLKHVSLRKWAYRPETRLKAQFGHVLFPLADQNAERPHFLPALPGLSTIFNDESFMSSFTTNPTLCYDFIAKPGSGNDTSDGLYTVPRLSIYFRPKNGQYQLKKAVLTFGETKHDVLLPDQAVDIQFVTNQTVLMGDARGNKYLQSFQEQVANNLQSGGRLSAPNLDLDIPKWTVTGMKFDGRDDVMRVSYLFTGIRFHQSAWGQYQDSTVTYSTTQSGKLGAKTGIFSLLHGVNPKALKEPIADPPNALREFVNRVFDMAGTITKAATASQAGMKRIERKRETAKYPRVAPSATAATGAQAEKAAAQTVDSQDVLPSSQAQSDAGIPSTTMADVNVNIPIENEAAIPLDSQVPEGSITDPFLSSMLRDDAASPDAFDESQTTTSSGEEPTEDEQKRSMQSTA